MSPFPVPCTKLSVTCFKSNGHGLCSSSLPALLMHATALPPSVGLMCDPVVQVVSAMEAIGVAELIGKFSADPGNPKVSRKQLKVCAED